MPIKFIKNASIFDSKCQYLVNPVNCVGVMGAGLALEFKNRYPDMYKEYRKTCMNKSNNIQPGNLIVYKNPPVHIINFCTKNHWESPSIMGWIILGLDNFHYWYKYYGVESVAFPKLGCGLGGLDWNNVRVQMINRLPKDIEIEIYE